ncbi:uncharacterized protein LOC130517395 [Takifugu flavidus]|uniref:uncharacterized protein LOC130517395 n=1 Tax=Takifugu flavidus TaxID=433684 RepID=UPI002544109A|nr:uncharacterized protein LOC130517395 [Takifugu flavidus]
MEVKHPCALFQSAHTILLTIFTQGFGTCCSLNLSGPQMELLKITFFVVFLTTASATPWSRSHRLGGPNRDWRYLLQKWLWLMKCDSSDSSENSSEEVTSPTPTAVTTTQITSTSSTGSISTVSTTGIGSTLSTGLASISTSEPSTTPEAPITSTSAATSTSTALTGGTTTTPRGDTR